MLDYGFGLKTDHNLVRELLNQNFKLEIKKI